MSGFAKGVALFAGMVLMLATVGCDCGLCKRFKAEEQAPVVTSPPPAPYVEPAPAPQPPPPAPLPPAVTKSIQELSEKYPGLFAFDKDTGLLRFRADAMFDSGSAEVKPEAEAALGKLAKILNEEGASDRKLSIIGHTDTDPVVKTPTIRMLKKLDKPVNNIGLSEARAEAVATVLEDGGVDGLRITTEGKGDTEPVASNQTDKGKARNRRVEVYVTAKSRS